jgi:hypothetical protein
MRTFVRLREALAPQRELAAKLADLERKIAGHDESIRTLFDALSFSVVGEIQDVANGARDPAKEGGRYARQWPLNQAAVVDGAHLVDEQVRSLPQPA